MTIVVVGIGCRSCRATERNVSQACTELDITAEISHVREARRFPSLSAVDTPAVLVDGKVVSFGRVPAVDELKRILRLNIGGRE